MNEIIIKKANTNIIEELNLIKFDTSYINIAKDKYNGDCYKLFNLKPHEANILKQCCLSLGFDCAVSRETIMCDCVYTDALIFATISQIKKLTNKLQSQPFRLKQIATEFNNIIKKELKTLTINNKTFDWSKPYIMGIVNVTPDSFSDGNNKTTEELFKYILNLIEDGADIIDIGGESTRPNSNTITIEEEINRVIPLINKIREEKIDIPISIDTRNYLTAKKAIDAGANIINDVSFLKDKELKEYINENNIPLILTHSNNIPAENKDFTDKNIIEQIYFELKEKLSELTTENIIIDLGIGFGKSKETNFEILKRIEEFKTLNKPILSGISRKSFITKEYNISTDEADIPTALYSALLSTKGVQIHRVHNVKKTKEFLDYINKFI